MGKNIKQYENILEKIIIKFGIEIENRDNALEVISCLKEKKVSISTINVYPNIINIKASKVANIIDAFVESNLPIEILEKNPSIIEKTNGARVKKIAELLNNKVISKKILEKFPEIVAVGKDDNIVNILKIFQGIKVDKKYFETIGGDILAYADSIEVKKIIAVLEKNDLLKAVLKKYPKVFYANNSAVIEDIIKLYKNPKEKLGIGILKKHPEILAETTKVRIQAIVNMLERNGIEKNVITKTPEIVYTNETKEIENIINKIKGYGISKEEINNAPEILTYDEVSVNKLLRKLEFITAYDDIFKNVINNDFREIVSANMQNLIDFVEEIEKGNLDRNIIELNPEIISKTTPKKVEETIRNLKSLGMEQYYIKNKQILLISEPQKILDIVKTFEELDIDKELLENPVIFLDGDSENIYNIVSEIDKRKMSRDILKNNFILVKGEYDNISKILEKLENEHVDLSTNIINKSTTILSESTPEDLDDVKKFLESKKLLNNPEVDIPGILFAKGKKENMEKVYNFFERNGLLNELKGAMSLLCRPILNIEKNFDLVIENGMINELLNNISVLGLGSETIEKRLKYLEKIGEDKTILALKMTGDKFNKRYNSTDTKLDAAVEDEYYAQSIIESRFSDYLERDERELKNIREEKFFENILENILELGIVRKKFEYYKCGYSYSMIKIKSNLNKLITYAIEDLGIENISVKDKIYIIVLSILGNKKVSEKEAEEVCRSIIKKEKEAEINPQLVEKDVHKISVVTEKSDKSIEEDVKDEITEVEVEVAEEENTETKVAELNGDELLSDSDFEDIEKDEIEEELDIENKNNSNASIDSSNSNSLDNSNNKDEEEDYSSEDYEQDLADLGIEEDIIDEKPNNTKTIREIANVNTTVKEENKVVNVEKASTVGVQNVYADEKAKEETVDKYKIDIEELKREREAQKQYQENEMLRLRKQLDEMKISILNFKKEAEERRIEEQERKYREEKEELSRIIQRRQEKELEELRKRNEELEKERKRREEEDIQRKIAEEAERITREEIQKLQEELKQKEKIQKEYEEKVKEDAKKAIQEAIEIEKIKLSKRPVIDLSREIDKSEEAMKKENLKEEIKEEIIEKNVADEYDEISELTGNMRNDSIDAYITEDVIPNNIQTNNISNNNMYNQNDIIVENDDINSFEGIDEITGKRINPNRNIQQPQYQPQNINTSNMNTNTSIQTNSNINMGITNMQQQEAYNRSNFGYTQGNNFGNSEEFNRTIDAYYNPNKKPFFNLEDYGYILNAVNEEEQKRIQTEMNELYKRKKNNYYDA